jgi:hypothetical protein
MDYLYLAENVLREFCIIPASSQYEDKRVAYLDSVDNRLS